MRCTRYLCVFFSYLHNILYSAQSIFISVWMGFATTYWQRSSLRVIKSTGYCLSFNWSSLNNGVYATSSSTSFQMAYFVAYPVDLCLSILQQSTNDTQAGRFKPFTHSFIVFDCSFQADKFFSNFRIGGHRGSPVIFENVNVQVEL